MILTFIYVILEYCLKKLNLDIYDDNKIRKYVFITISIALKLNKITAYIEKAFLHTKICSFTLYQNLI